MYASLQGTIERQLHTPSALSFGEYSITTTVEDISQHAFGDEDEDGSNDLDLLLWPWIPTMTTLPLLTEELERFLKEQELTLVVEVVVPGEDVRRARGVPAVVPVVVVVVALLPPDGLLVQPKRSMSSARNLVPEKCTAGYF